MSQDPQQNPQDPQPQEQPAKPRKRRRWPWVVLALAVLLVGLLLLGPTIASTGAVRSMLLGKVNEQLNGSVKIDDWSLGWVTPIRVNGIKVYDDQQRLILDVARVQLGISLLGAIRQNFNFGQDNLIDIASVDVRVDENGKTNLEKLAKSGPPPQRPKEPSGKERAPAQPVKLPDVSGKFTVTIQNGTVEVPQGAPVHIDPSTIVANIKSINDPIENAVKLAYHVGDAGTAGSSIEVNGSVDAIDNNEPQPDKLTGKQKVVLNNVNLAAAEPFLKKLGPQTRVGGNTNGTIDLDIQGLTGISAAGTVTIKDLLFAGEAINGDTYTSPTVSIPLNITRNNGRIKIENVGIQTAESNITITGEVPEQALTNVASGAAPGSEGSITVKTSVDVAKLAAQLPRTLKIEEGVKVQSGTINNDLVVAFKADRVTISEKLQASAEGTRNNKPIKLQPITVTFDAGAIPTAGKMPDVRDLKLAINSDFATIQGGGESLGKVDINGKFELGTLRSELAQFMDLGDLQLQGSGDLAINTKGDVANPNAPIDAGLKVNIQNVKISGVASQEIGQDQLAIAAGGKLTRKDNAPIGLEGGNVKIVSGQPNSPLLDVDLTADADLTKSAVPKWEIKKLNVTDLKALQEQYGALVPALKQQNIRITGGSLRVSGEGSYDGTTAILTKPLDLTIPGLSISRDNKPVLNREVIRATVGGSFSHGTGGTSANLSQLALLSEGNLFKVTKAENTPLLLSIKPDGSIEGDGAIALSSDLHKLISVLQGLQGAKPTADQPQLSSGMFSGSVTLKRAATTDINFNGQITQLSIEQEKQKKVENEQVTIALTAQVPNDINGKESIKASGKIGSSFVNTTLSDIKLSLNGGMLEMLQSATVAVQAPDLSKLYALYAAATPTTKPAPDAAPEPELQVTSGAADIKLAVTRDPSKKETTVEVSQMQLTNVALKRGERPYKFERPVSLKLKAVASGTDQPTAINVSELNGDLTLARLEMPSPIKVTGLETGKPSAQGVIKLTGKMDDAAKLLSVLQNAEPLPYSFDYQVTQQLATAATGTTLEGAIDLNKFSVKDKSNTVVFSEDQIAVRNNVELNMPTNTATVKSLSVDMPKSQALALKMNAKIADWVNARSISGSASDKAQIDLAYDLEKLWPIIKPMLSPEMQQQYKDLKITGKYSKTFTVSGAYPNKPTMGESIASLNADGSLALDVLNLPQGLGIEKFELPFVMTRGVLVTKAAPEPRRAPTEADAAIARGAVPTTQRGLVATTALANEGALNLDNIKLDLGRPSPLLTIPPRQVLLRNVKLNTVLANSLGKMGFIIFTNSSTAEGLLTVNALRCDQLPIADLMNQKQKGEAVFAIAVKELHLDGIIPTIISKVAHLDTDGLRGDISSSSVKLDDGQAQVDITVNVLRGAVDERGRQVTKALPMKMNGGVVLSNLELRDFKVELTKELVRGEMAKIFPNGAVLPLTGTANKPNPFDLAELTKANLGNALEGILGGGQKPSDSTNRDNAQPGQNQPRNSNPLGGLLEQLGGGNRNQNAAPTPAPQGQQQAPARPQPAPQQVSPAQRQAAPATQPARNARRGGAATQPAR